MGNSQIADANKKMKEGDVAGAVLKYEEHLIKQPRDAHALNQYGVLKQSIGKYAEALELHKKSIEIDKTQYIYWYNLGVALFNLDEFDKCLEALEQCSQLNRSYQKILHLKGQIALKRQKLDEARQIFELALQQQPEDGLSYFYLGDICYQKQQYDMAFDLFQKCLQYEKQHLHALNQSGLISYNRGHYDKAREFYQLALNVDGENSSIWNNLGSVFYEQGEYQEAARCFKRSLLLRPDNYFVLNFLGLSLNKLENYPEALSVFQQAIRIGPDHFEAWNNIGLCLYYLGRYMEAIESCARAIKLNSRSHTSYSNMGLAKDKLGLHEEAIKLFEKSLEINPKSSIVWNNLGLSYYQLRKYAEAISKYEISLECDPRSPNTWVNLGLAHQKSGNLKRSIECFTQSVLLRPDNYLFRNHLAQALMEDQQYEAAIQSFREAVALKQDFFEAFNFLGLAHLKLDRYEEAFLYFAQCLQIQPLFLVAKINLQVTVRCMELQKQVRDLETELAHHPHDPARHLLRAIKLMQLKRFLPALQAVETAISYNPFLLQAYSRRSVLLGLLGRTEEQVLTNFDATVQYFAYANKLLQQYLVAAGAPNDSQDAPPELVRLAEVWRQTHEKILLSEVYFDISIESLQQFSAQQKERLRTRLKIFRDTKLWQCVIRLYQRLAEHHAGAPEELRLLVKLFAPIFEVLFIFYFILQDDAQMVDINSSLVLSFKPRMSRLELEPRTRKLSDQASNAEENALRMEQSNIEFLEKQQLEPCEFDEILELVTRDVPCVRVIVSILQSKIFERGLSILQDPTRIAFTFNRDIVDFPKKEFIFRLEIYSLQQRFFDKEEISLTVQRSATFQSSFTQIQRFSDKDLRLGFKIRFFGEEGQDLGGLFREWLQILSKELFNEDYGLFRLTETGVKYFPNKDCFQVDDKELILQYYQFIGKILGKALWENQLMDIQFTRGFYKHLLGLPITYHDLEDQDNVLYKNLKLMAENSMTELGLEETWSVIEDNFGETKIIDLIPNGRNIDVTEEDKLEFIQKKSYYHMAQCVQEQIESILEGFYKIIPAYSMNIFKVEELEMILSGSPDIDLIDLKKNTEYVNYTESSQVIIWFWRLLESLTKEEKTLFLQFVTGSSRVPAEGFSVLKGWNGTQIFNIHRVENDQSLPTANTCFNQLKLPEYKSYDVLKDKFLMAIKEGKDGFGLV